MSDATPDAMPHDRLREHLRAFFADYARATVDGDAARIVAAYGEAYMEAAPAGVQTLVVDAEYRQALAGKSRMMREQLGLNGADAQVREVRDIAPPHHLATVDWTLRFTPPGKAAVASRFTIGYVVRVAGDGAPTILLSVSHEDEEAAMREAGLL